MTVSFSSPQAPTMAPAAAPQQAQLLASSALHLMTHYSAQAAQAGSCVKLASVIERHLKALASHGELNPVLRATCEQLSEQWAAVVDQAVQRPAPRSLFGRVL